jgi:hypothetical protein
LSKYRQYGSKNQLDSLELTHHPIESISHWQARHEEERKMADRIALLIGNSKYSDSKLKKLQKPEADVFGLQRVFEDKRIGAFTEAIPLLEATFVKMRTSIESLFNGRHRDDLLLLYFAGHGIRDDDGYLYLAASDTETESLRATGVRADYITELMEKSYSRRQLLILDCCFSGAFAHGTRGGMSTDEKVITRSLFRGEGGYGRAVITASSATQYAWEDDEIVGEAENSLFTHYFIKGLETGEADHDMDGLVTVDELHNYIYDKVSKAKNRKQTPKKWVYNLEGLLWVARNPKLSENVESNCASIPDTSRVSSQTIDVLVRDVQDSVCPLLEELGQSSTAQNLYEKAANLGALNSQSSITPVALIGVTGSGKTSLTNAILDQILGIAGGGEAQSASALTVGYNPQRYEVEVSYVEMDELLELLNRIHFNTKHKNLLKRPDEQYMTSSLRRFLSAILKNSQIISQHEITVEDLNEDVVHLVKIGSQTKSFYADEFYDLKDYVRHRTNSKGRFWAITHEVQVSGPFPGLSSDGRHLNIVLMDLPGLGDLNETRVERTRRALSKADQILIIVDDRGIRSSIKELLGEARIISYLLSNPSISQVVFVGTKLDIGISTVTPDELNQLNLPMDAHENAIVRARFLSWRQTVREQWQRMLTQWSTGTRIKGRQHHNSVAEILAHSDYIPCSPPAYLALRGFLPDRGGFNRTLYSQPGNSQKEMLANTGIPAVRDSIHRLASEQENLRQIKISEKRQDLRSSVLNHCEPLLNLILQEIEYSKSTRDHYLTVESSLRSLKRQAARFNAQPVCNAAAKQLRHLQSIFKEGWEDLTLETLNELINAELGDVHFQTFKAALIRKGVFQSSGKSQRRINLPNEIGDYIVEPCASYINGEVLPEFLNGCRATVQEDARDFQKSINTIRSESLEEIENEDLGAFWENTQSALDEYWKDVKDLIDNELTRVNQLDIDSVQAAHNAIASGFDSVMRKSIEREGRGRGARQRTINELVCQIDNRKREILKDMSAILRGQITTILREYASDLRTSAINRKEALLVSILESGNTLLTQMDRPEQKETAKALHQALQKIK